MNPAVTPEPAPTGDGEPMTVKTALRQIDAAETSDDIITVCGVRMRRAADGAIEIVCSKCLRSVAVLDSLGNPYWYRWGGGLDGDDPRCVPSCAMPVSVEKK